MPKIVLAFSKDWRQEVRYVEAERAWGVLGEVCDMDEQSKRLCARAPQEHPHTGPPSVFGPVAEEHGTRDRAATRLG